MVGVRLHSQASLALGDRVKILFQVDSQKHFTLRRALERERAPFGLTGFGLKIGTKRGLFEEGEVPSIPTKLFNPLPSVPTVF